MNGVVSASGMPLFRTVMQQIGIMAHDAVLVPRVVDDGSSIDKTMSVMIAIMLKTCVIITSLHQAVRFDLRI